MNLIWLIPLLPGVGAAINGLAGVRYFSRRTAGLLACSLMAGALGLSLVACWQLLALPPSAREHDVVVAQWIPRLALHLRGGGVGALQVPWGFRLDPLSALMILVVTGVGTLIHIYSIGYMADEPRGAFARYFSYLNLFCFFMLMLVLGDNYLVMFVGWEGVGLCSYLLIGYWYEKKSASDAGKKAFITNRIGDWGFILGVFLVFYTFGTFDFRAVQDAAAAMPLEATHFGVLSFICLFLFVGATGKSAQIPLYVWLPDAMEGPTPVSALIHAATMVTAGVYMLGRNAVLFSQAPMVMTIVAIVGVLTAFMAATIGLVQYDIKRVLAYSTVSQLGYMFTAMGVGAFSAGVFHLMTHAFFKALLFLCSGSVIHAMAGEQDMRRMGGLKRYLPVTFATMMVGTVAIAGIPPLAGFFSKDEILFQAFLANKAIWAIAVITALMTAFYMFRLVSMTFYGAYRGPAWGEAHGHVARAVPPAPLLERGGNPRPVSEERGGNPRPVSEERGGNPRPVSEERGDQAGKPRPVNEDRVKDIRVAAEHGAPHPTDPHAHGQAHQVRHEVAHGPAEPHDDAGHAGAPHGVWHGPHESPRVMTVPLMALAVGAIVAGFVGVPAALGGGNAIERFLEPSFSPSAVSAADQSEGVARVEGAARIEGAPKHTGAAVVPGEEPVEGERIGRGGEIALMAFSVVVAALGIGLAYRFYVTRPEISVRLATRWSGAHQVLMNKYYVDEFYNATVIEGTFAGGHSFWTFDRRVVDGAVNGSGWLTLFTSWLSGLTDRTLVDGLVNLVARVCEEGSYWFRRLQTGLVQNYALLMLLGIFAFVTVYLFAR